MIEDSILLKKACCGCRPSLSAIYSRYVPVIFEYIKRAGAGSNAEDICQAVFVLILEGRCNYDTQTAAENYLCTIAKNILRDRRKVHTEVLYSPELFKAIVETRVDAEADILKIGADRHFLRQSIAELPAKSRQAIRIYLRENSVHNVASNDKAAAFRMRLNYGIKLLREKFTSS